MMCTGDTKESITSMDDYKPMVTKTIKVHTRYNMHKITKNQENTKVGLSDDRLCHIEEERTFRQSAQHDSM